MDFEAETDLIDLDMVKVWALVEAMMHSPMGQADRPHSAAACLLTYCILVCPDPLPRAVLADLMEQASTRLLPLMVETILAQEVPAVLPLPTQES